MKALTIHQPYAALIALPDDDARAKRVENRNWPHSHVGRLAIHAGKSRERLAISSSGMDLEYHLPIESMAFGAIVAVADMRGCFKAEALVNRETGRHLGGLAAPWALRKWPWLADHQHVEGPYCFVLAEVRCFREPIPATGWQGMWEWTPPDGWESLLV